MPNPLASHVGSSYMRESLAARVQRDELHAPYRGTRDPTHSHFMARNSTRDIHVIYEAQKRGWDFERFKRQ